MTISTGPASLGTPRYLKLSMATTGVGDYRIVSLWLAMAAVPLPVLPRSSRPLAHSRV